MFKIHFKSAWESMRRSPFQAMSAILVLANTFFVVSVLGILVYATNQTITYFETRPQVISFLKDDLEQEKLDSLIKQLEGDYRIKDVRYVSKEDALEIYKKATEDNPLLTELVNPSVLPASIDFSVKDLSFVNDVMNEVKGSELVDEVCFTASLDCQEGLSDVVNNLREATWYVRIGGGIFAGMLLISSFFVLTVIISMRLTTRKEEIEILNLIGATRNFIRFPVILEGIFYTLIGITLGWIAALIVTLYATPSVIQYFGEIPVIPKSTVDLLSIFGVIFAFEAIIGILMAVFGSSISLSRIKRT